jgi:hypothetical protein
MRASRQKNAYEDRSSRHWPHQALQVWQFCHRVLVSSTLTPDGYRQLSFLKGKGAHKFSLVLSFFLTGKDREKVDAHPLTTRWPGVRAPAASRDG